MYEHYKVGFIIIYILCITTLKFRKALVIHSRLNRVPDSKSLFLKHYTIYHSLHACVLSCFSHARLFAALWTVAHQAPLSMGLSRQESWSGLPCPPPGDLPDPGTELESPAALHCRQILYSWATGKPTMGHDNKASPSALQELFKRNFEP